MFCATRRGRKNGKEHRYYSLVEIGGWPVAGWCSGHALYLGEINDSQEEAWRKTIEIFQEGQARPRTVALFPEDRSARWPMKDIVRIRLSQFRCTGPGNGALAG